METLPSFAHRRNRYGSHDSICTKCYATAASAGSEELLSSSESAHVCDPTALYHATEGFILARIAMLAELAIDECLPDEEAHALGSYMPSYHVTTGRHG
jgi:hypothetical protein